MPALVPVAPEAATPVNTAAVSPLTRPVAVKPETLWAWPLYVGFALLAVTVAFALPMVSAPLV